MAAKEAGAGGVEKVAGVTLSINGRFNAVYTLLCFSYFTGYVKIYLLLFGGL